MGSFADHVLAELPGSKLSVIDKLTEFFARGRPVKLTDGPPTDADYVNTPGDGACAFDFVGGHFYVRSGVDTWVDIGPGGGGGGGAPTNATYLVTAGHVDLTNEVIVGATPNGELGGTWGAITVDAVHSGSAHHAEAHAINGAGHTGTLDDAQIPAAIARDTEVATAVTNHEAAGDPHTVYATNAELTTHEGAVDPHTGYQKESEKGNANGYASLDGAGTIPDAQIPAAIARDSELHAQNHTDTQHTDGPNSKPGHQHSHDTDLTGVSADDHHAQSHTHASHTGIGANDHHNQAHVLDSSDHTVSGKTAGQFLRATGATSFAFEAIVISRGGTVVKSDGVAVINVIVWRAPYACTVTNVRGYRVGGTGATINARRNGADNHLSSALSLTSADTWMDGGSVQNTSYVAGDKMEIMVVSVAGTPTQIAIQVDLTRP